jgi:hypothetical protein
MKTTIKKAIAATLLLLLALIPLAYAEESEESHRNENSDDRKIWDFSDDFNEIEEEAEETHLAIVGPTIQTHSVSDNLSLKDIAPPVVTAKNLTLKNRNSTIDNSTVFVPSWNEKSIVNLNQPKASSLWKNLLMWLGVVTR